MTQQQYEAAKKSMTDHISIIEDLIMPEFEKIIESTKSNSIGMYWNTLSSTLGKIKYIVERLENEYSLNDGKK